MPTVKIDINTGIEYSPTDGIDSAVKLHNFTVGTDGSLYKLPALKNLKNSYRQVWDDGLNRIWWLYRLLDIHKFQTSSIEEPIVFPPGFPATQYSFREINMFRRFIYLRIIRSGSAGMTLMTRLCHASGQWIESSMTVNPPKQDIQSLGSYLTYLRRYTYSAIVGVVASEEDDDGEAATGRD